MKTFCALALVGARILPGPALTGADPQSELPRASALMIRGFLDAGPR